jgi:hypothetical protein
MELHLGMKNYYFDLNYTLTKRKNFYLWSRDVAWSYVLHAVGENIYFLTFLL